MDFDRGMSWCLAASIVAAIGIGGAAKGQQIDALFRTNLPTYTTNNTPSTLIVDVNGRLRVAAEGPGGAAIAVASAAGSEVQGTTEDGVAPVGTADKPVLVGGRDPNTGLVQTVQTDAAGGLAITTSAAGAGAVTATTPRTTLANDDPAVASLSVLDDWDEVNRAAVNAIAGQVGVQGAAGAATALTIRTTQATDDAAAVALADDSIALEAGTATVGSIGAIVNALPAGGNNIGDVDVLTINGQAPAFGAGAAGATVLRTTQSTDDPVPLATTTDGGAASTRVVVVAGHDGANAQQFLTAASGALRVDPTGTTAQPVTDAAGSLTVDAPVGTPVFTRLSDGAAAQGTVGNPLFARVSDGIDSNLVTAAGELNVISTAQPGVDLGDVTLTTGTATVGSASALGTAGTPLEQGTGAITAGTARVTMATNDTVATDLTNIRTDTDSLAVTGNGASATAQRVTLSNDSTGQVTLAAGTATVGSVQVINALANPVNVRLGDGTDQTLVTAAGELNVLATAQPGVDVGDVTVNNAAGAAAVNVQDGGNALTVDWAGVAPPIGAGTEAAALRVAVATDSTIALEAGTATIGTVIADTELPTPVVLTDGLATPTVPQVGSHLLAWQPNSAAWDRVQIDTAERLIVRADVVNQLPAGVNNIGDVDVLTLPGALTGLAEDAVHNTGDVGVEALAVHSDTAQTLAGANGDYAPAVLTRLGAHRAAAQPEAYIDSLGAYYLVQTAFTTITTGGAAEIQPVAAQGAGNSIVLLDWIISSSASQTTMQFESDGSDAGITLQVQNATAWTSDHPAAWGETADNDALKLQVSTAATVSVQVRYFVR